MKNGLYCLLCFIFICFFSNVSSASDFNFGLGTETKFGGTYYGFYNNPYKATQSVFGQAKYDILGKSGEFGYFNYLGYLELAYDHDVKNSNQWANGHSLFWNKRWENFLVTEVGWKTDQRLLQMDKYTQEFYGKAQVIVDEIPFNPYIQYTREFREFGYGMTSLGTEQTFNLEKQTKIPFGVYTKAEVRYMNIDSGSSLNMPGKTFNNWHSYSLVAGLPIWYNNFMFTPSIEYVGYLNSQSKQLMNVKSYNGSTPDAFITRLDFKATF